MAFVKDVIEKAYTKVNGEYEALLETSDDFKTYLNVLNQVMEDLAHMPYVKWNIFFDLNYLLPDEVEADKLFYDVATLNGITISNTPFDHIFFVNEATGEVIDKYKIVSLAQFQSSDNEKIACIAKGGLYLKKIGADLVGTKIRMPVYVDPPTYVLGNEVVVIDSVPYLVKAMAAFICDASPVPFIARNADKFAKEAQVSLKEMKENNKRNQLLIIKTLNASAPHTWDDVLQTLTMKDL